MKLYLAGPMRGIDEENFPAFAIAAERLRALGHEVLVPTEEDIARWGTTNVEAICKKFDLTTDSIVRAALGYDLAYICEHAEGIALLKGWEKSKGATAEYYTALALGLAVIVQDEFGWRKMKSRIRKAAV